MAAVCSSAKDVVTGEKVAIKRVAPMARKQNDAKHTLREICLMQSLGAHPNPLSESHYKFFLHQILRGVKHLHDNGVLHRDLKPGNILVTKNCQVKIADFGLARSVPKRAPPKPRPASAGPTKKEPPEPDWQPMTEHIVTRWYRAPELMLQPDGQYSTGVDMWSVGCIFAEILGRKAVFPGKNFIHQLTLIFDVIGTPCGNDVKKMKSSQAQRFIKSLGKKAKVPFRTLFPTASPDAIDLLEKLLQFDPHTRCSVDEALAHPYMQGIDKRYAYKDIAVPAGRMHMSFESQSLSRNDLVKLIQQEVHAFHSNATADDSTSSPNTAAASITNLSTAASTSTAHQTPAGLRTIHALSRQSTITPQHTKPPAKETDRVTCQNLDLMKTMLGSATPSISTSNQVVIAKSPPRGSGQATRVSLPMTQNNDADEGAPLDAVHVVGLTSLLARTRPTSAAHTRPTPATQPPVFASTGQPTTTLPTTSSMRPTSAARTRPPIVIPTHAAADVQPAQSSSSSSSSSDDDRPPRPSAARMAAASTPTSSARPKSAPGRTALQKHSTPCVGSTASLIRSTQQLRKPSHQTSAAQQPPQPPTANRLPEGQQDNDLEPAKKGKKLTVPRSPKFSVMSWQKTRPATAKPGKPTTARGGVKKR
ncbi:hypothetical protein DYB37_000519 [Aphanomyces astaci]|uniref:Protein kinase domain-containing protein n=1 Tax=Aphanomyces astaci TaxID=112090 RepID=A0A3R7ACZ4_APHAT|nr:hypothetical protein DYB37_000519 [Aphanomyces astaci]